MKTLILLLLLITPLAYGEDKPKGIPLDLFSHTSEGNADGFMRPTLYEIAALQERVEPEKKAPQPAKYEDPAEVSITKEQEQQLDLIGSQFREAVAVEEAAKAKKESAQLKYTLLVMQLRALLKVGDDYQFDEASKKFKRAKVAAAKGQ